MAIQLEGNIEALRIYEYLTKVLGTSDLANYFLLIDKSGEARAQKVSLASLLAFSGSQFYDNLFKLISNIDDNELSFVLDNLTANRVISVPDKNITLAGLDDIYGFTTTETAGGTTTLTTASTYNQEFTGATTQTIQMPVVSTLELGREFKIINNSTGILTVNSSGSDLITTIPAGKTKIFTCVKIPGTDETSWSVADFGGNIGNYTITTGATYTPNLDVDKNEIWCVEYIQSGSVTPANTFSNGQASKMYIPVETNGDNWNFPAEWIKFKNDYLFDSASYFLELFYDGENIIYSFIRKNNSLVVDFVTASVTSDNTYIEFEINYSCYSDIGLSNPLILADFDVTFSQNGGTATGWTPTSITNDAGGALVGGETTFRIYGTLTGTSDGNETLEVSPADGASVVGSTELGAQYMESDKSSGEINMNADLDFIAEFDASDNSTVTTVDGQVSLWEDKSLNGYDASQATGALQPDHNDSGNYIQFTNSGTEFLNIGDILDLEFQDDDEFSVLIDVAIGDSTNSCFIISNRATSLVGGTGWCVQTSAGILYLILHDGTSTRNVTDSVDYSDYVSRKFIFTHLSDGKMYMYDATNNQIASNESGQLSAINYTGLESNIGARNKNQPAGTAYGNWRATHIKVFGYVLNSAQRASELGL